MELLTTRFGKIEFADERIVNMKKGLIGFADRCRFITITPAENSVLLWYQSVDDPGLAFVITSPALFAPDYRVPFSPYLLQNLEARGPEELDVYVLVTIPSGRPREMTGNLIGPLVINPRTRLAEQLVLDDPRYTHKQPLLLKPGS